MRWEDERYVRIYTRDTTELCLLSWQARALLWELIRKGDLSGFIAVGKAGIRGLALLVRMPADVVEQALRGEDGLLADGCLVEVDGGLALPNYVEAQQARSSDKLRKQEQRSRDAAERLRSARPVGDEAGRSVTPGDQTGQPVTPCDGKSQNVTDSHMPSPAVTDGHSEPSLAKLSQAQSFTPSTPALVLVPGVAAVSKRATKTRKAPEPLDPHPRFSEVVEAYFVAFEAHRGTKPIFDSRDGKSVNALLARCKDDADRAIEAIRSAFNGDPFLAKNATITTIAADPSKYLGKAKPSGTGLQHGLQKFVANGDYDGGGFVDT